MKDVKYSPEAIKRKQYIIDGIKKDIVITKNEKPVFTFLGSTDRKWYTIEFTGSYMDKEYKSYMRVEPFDDEATTKEAMQRAEEEIRHSFALRIYVDSLI